MDKRVDAAAAAGAYADLQQSLGWQLLTVKLEQLLGAALTRLETVPASDAAQVAKAQEHVAMLRFLAELPMTLQRKAEDRARPPETVDGEAAGD